MRLLIAPNAFKNSLTAKAAAEAIREGLRRSRLSAEYACFPIADGGDGTAELLIERLRATRVEVPVQDPLGRPIGAAYGMAITTAAQIPMPAQAATSGHIGTSGHIAASGRVAAVGHVAAAGPVAIIGMASASGLDLLRPEERDPLHLSSIGTGQLLRSAISQGARRVVLAVGGSATVDGGAGILHALGARYLDAAGNTLEPIPAQLLQLARIDLSDLYAPVRDTQIVVLCDVDNPLLGDQGAASVFGPQKGATPETVVLLERVLTRMSEVITRMSEVAGGDVASLARGSDMASVARGGAAGGTAAGLYALLGAHLVSGSAYFLDAARFDASLETADLVVTGEGSLDAQTLRGKGPFAVAERARARGIPVIGLAGRIPPGDEAALKHFFQALFPIGNGPADLDQAIRDTEANLIRTAREIGDVLALDNHR